MNAPAEPRIAVTRNGPYIVTGHVPLLRLAAIPAAANDWDVEATLPPRQSYALCRCGRSKMAPFCDYKHQRGFDGTETAEQSPEAEVGETCEPPSIGFAAKGPLFLRGAVAVVSADGSAYPGHQPVCRCGASANKPFCDGSHERNG